MDDVSADNQALIVQFSNMREQITCLIEHLKEMDNIIQDEATAVNISDLRAIEILVPNKETLAAKIEKAIVALRDDLRDLKSKGILVQESNKEGLDLSDLLTGLSSLKSASTARNMESQVLQHTIEKLSESTRLLIDLRKHTHPKIEANAYLVRKLLQHHQETYLFWQSVVLETESVYGSHGRTKIANTKSILEIKT